MVVTTIIGGMGNQLRAYASAYTVARYVNQPLALDVSDYFGGYFRPYVLDRLNIPDHLKLYYPHKKPLYHCPYGTPGNFLKAFDCILNIDRIKDRRELLAAVEGKENIWLMGYGKLSFCTQEEQQQLKSLFQPMVRNKCLLSFAQKAEKEESIAVHVRRTDFIDNEWISEETLKYYQAAVSYMSRQFDQSEFYFFSDDMEWTKRMFGCRENYHYVHCLGGMESDMEELFLMAACKHHILTDRSTFGAWAVFLSTHTDGLNIVNGKELDIPGSLAMDSRMIEEWLLAYEGEQEAQREIIVPWRELEQKLEANDNGAVLDYIDGLCLDSYGILTEAKEKLTELKGIAYIQNNDVVAALSVFDYLQQSQREFFDFSFNYSVALKMAGHHTESLIYLGNALRINKSGVPHEFLDDLSRQDERVLGLVSGQKKRHYILLNLPWVFTKNVRGYYESIVAMLRNMGNIVTIAEIQEDCTVTGEWNQNCKDRVLSRMLSTVEKQDRVYDWGIDKYQVHSVNVNGRCILTPADLLSCLMREEDEVILLTHSLEGVRSAASSYPLIFLDAISEWDAQKETLNSYGESEWSEIYSCAAKVITKRELPSEWSHRKVMPLVCESSIGADEICFREERITELSHYMRNEEMLYGVLSVLKAVEEMESGENYYGSN